MKKFFYLILTMFLAFGFTFSAAPAYGDHKAQTAADAGDNRHPSGKDRSVEKGKSGDQGKSKSDPDGNENSGPDKPGGRGGVDHGDQDGNNGCGNDDDFEDDNNGNCGGKPDKAKPVETPSKPVEKPTKPANPSKPDKPATPPTSKPTPAKTAKPVTPVETHVPRPTKPATVITIKPPVRTKAPFQNITPVAPAAPKLQTQAPSVTVDTQTVTPQSGTPDNLPHTGLALKVLVTVAVVAIIIGLMLYFGGYLS